MALPTRTAESTLGTALNKILKDFIIKARTMSGFDAPYVPGWDCHGLPIELQVDRQLGKKKRELSVAAFRQECRRYAETYVGLMRDDFKRLGILGQVGVAVSDDALLLSGSDRPGPRVACSARHDLQGQEAGPLVHSLPDGSGGGRSRVRATHLAVHLRRVRVGLREYGGLRASRTVGRWPTGLGPDLDDDTLDHSIRISRSRSIQT